MVNDFPLERDYDSIPANEFINEIKSWRIDNNDVGLIVYAGHGPVPTFYRLVGENEYVKEHVYAKEFKDLIDSINFGRLIFVHGACQAEMYLQQLSREGLEKNVVAIGAMSEMETGGITGAFRFLGNLTKGYSINEAFEDARKYASNEKIWQQPEHPVKYFYGKDDSWCNYESFFKYTKKQ